MRIRTFCIGVAAAITLAACGGEEAAPEPETDEATEATADETDAADAEDVSTATEDEEEFDASVDPDRIITSITFAGSEHDIRDIHCDDFGHMWRLTAQIDTVHAGGDRVMITEHEDREGAEVQLNILDEEAETEVIWSADAIADLDIQTGLDGSAAGTVLLHLPEHQVGPRDDEELTFDLACDDAH